jgi:MFS family permease
MTIDLNLRALGAMAILIVVNALSQSGATLLAAVLPLLKVELHATDSELGLLTGYGSVLTVALLALPISGWAARFGTSRMLSACMVICGLGNVISAGCSSTWQMIMARLVSGTGPAGSWPLGQTLVSDLYPPRLRSGALAAYSIGDFLGATAPLLLGGWIAARYGWRSAFLVFGCAAIAAGLLQRWIVKDQTGASSDTDAIAETEVVADTKLHWKAALRQLWQQRTYVNIVLGFSWACFAVSGLSRWMPSFYNRQFGLAPESAAAYFGGAYAGGALIGLLLGGLIGNRLVAGRQQHRLLMFCMVTYLFTFPCILVVLFATNLKVALCAHVAATVFGSMPNGPVMSMIFMAVPRKLRVLASSMLLLTLTLMGDGGGPLLIGLLSDVLQPRFGNESLKYAMLAVKLLGLMLFVHLMPIYFRERRESKLPATLIPQTLLQ